MEANKTELIKFDWVLNEVKTIVYNSDIPKNNDKDDAKIIKFTEYINNMKKTNIYGGLIEIYCASRIFKCKFIIMALGYGENNVMKLDKKKFDKSPLVLREVETPR